MHNREITRIVKTDSLSKKSIDCKEQMFFFAVIWEKLMSKLKKQTKFYENTMQKLDLDFKDSNSLITSLCIEYIGEFMTLNQKDW